MAGSVPSIPTSGFLAVFGASCRTVIVRGFKCPFMPPRLPSALCFPFWSPRYTHLNHKGFLFSKRQTYNSTLFNGIMTLPNHCNIAMIVFLSFFFFLKPWYGCNPPKDKFTDMSYTCLYPLILLSTFPYHRKISQYIFLLWTQYFQNHEWKHRWFFFLVIISKWVPEKFLKIFSSPRRYQQIFCYTEIDMSNNQA